MKIMLFVYVELILGAACIVFGPADLATALFCAGILMTLIEIHGKMK